MDFTEPNCFQIWKIFFVGVFKIFKSVNFSKNNFKNQLLRDTVTAILKKKKNSNYNNLFFHKLMTGGGEGVLCSAISTNWKIQHKVDKPCNNRKIFKFKIKNIRGRRKCSFDKVQFFFFGGGGLDLFVKLKFIGVNYQRGKNLIKSD